MGVCLAGSLWLTLATSERALFAMEIAEGEPGLLRFPVWPARGIVAIGFALLVLEYAVRMCEEWHGAPAEEFFDTFVATVREMEAVSPLEATATELCAARAAG